MSPSFLRTALRVAGDAEAYRACLPNGAAALDADVRVNRILEAGAYERTHSYHLKLVSIAIVGYWFFIYENLAGSLAETNARDRCLAAPDGYENFAVAHILD
mgnify:CR=1 FL=1